MASRRLRSAVLLAAVLATVALAGCASGREGNAGREGRAEDLGGLAYNVFITRQVNLKDPEDAFYYHGPEAPPGSALYGVFISVCNESRGGPSYPSATSFKIEDTRGKDFYPMQLPASNDFAYHAGTVAHRECIPYAGSLPAQGPTGGAMLLFQLPLSATENRPLDLIIDAPPGSSGRQSVHIELDI